MELDLHISREHALEVMVDDHEGLVSSIKGKLMASVSHLHRICKVSERFYKDNEEKYRPIMVSIGPFHRGEAKLKAMEDQKWQYLNTLLSRKLDVKGSLERCIQALKLLEERARKCYGEEIGMESNEFVEMMLLDGCFIIELFLKACSRGLRRRGDMFLSTYQMFFRLRRDLILLENQIPFFVLEHLFSLVPIPKECAYSLTELAFHFFKKTVPVGSQYLQVKFGQEIYHLLDLVHQSFIPTTHIHQEHSHFVQQMNLQTNIGNATKLQKIGIEIKTAKSKSFLDVKFTDGVLKIPTFKIHDLIEIVLRNLIAMENCCYDATKYITSYAYFMKSLIQSNKDAKFLHKIGILDKGLGKEEDFVGLFHGISREVDVKDFYYRGLCDKVNKHGKVNSSVWYARKVRNCFTQCLREL